MPEVQDASATPALQDATSAAPTTPDSAAPADGLSTDAKTEDEQLGPTGLTALKTERAAREAAEKTARDLVKRIKAFEDKDKSESEKAVERIAELERENTELRARQRADSLRDAATAAARKVGFWDPDLAYALIDPAAVEFTEDGRPKNIEHLVGAIAREKPRLVNASPDFGGGPRGGVAPSGTDMNAAIRRAAGR
jgi:hypothetical protein